jgi:hypothetical protein
VSHSYWHRGPSPVAEDYNTKTYTGLVLALEVSVAKRPSLVSRHRQSIRPSTRFKRLPVWVSKADIIAYLKLSPTDAQAT